jgi:hypothetical protein
MQGSILLNYNENIQQVEEEEKSRFLHGLLEQVFENTNVGPLIQEIWGGAAVLSASQKVRLREIFTTYHIQVIDDLDGHLRILIDGELVAEWRKCTYKLKRDYSQIDPRKRLYLEMNVNCWSMFDTPEEHEIE